jgi:hypothetical protein
MTERRRKMADMHGSRPTGSVGSGHAEAFGSWAHRLRPVWSRSGQLRARVLAVSVMRGSACGLIGAVGLVD